MSQVVCSWAGLADDTDASAWYVNTHVPKVAAELGGTARNAIPAEENIFKEVAGIDGERMTLYDLPADAEVSKVDAQMQAASQKLPEDAKVETRIYDEWETWHGEQWCGHIHDIHMFLCVLWQPLDTVHDDFVEWFRGDFVPGMLESAELLRARIFKLQHASILQAGQTETKDTGKMYQYMTIWEFDCDELPWEIMIYLGSSDMWRHYVEGGYLQWQMAQYHVDQIFPEEGEQGSPAAT